MNGSLASRIQSHSLIEILIKLIEIKSMNEKYLNRFLRAPYILNEKTIKGLYNDTKDLEVSSRSATSPIRFLAGPPPLKAGF